LFFFATLPDPKLMCAYAFLESRSAAKGAETAIYLSVSPDVTTKSGLHWEDLKSTTCIFRNESQEDELLRVVNDLLIELGHAVDNFLPP
jgi:hypothetical protein